MTATTNGRPRKQLSDQLDRMDTIIDALAEALPEAVADATREGARQAVRDVVLEVLANPDLRALVAGLAPAAPPAAPAANAFPPPAPCPSTPSWWTRLKARLRAARDIAADRCRAAAASVTATFRALALVMPVRQILAVGAGVGVAIGALAYLCPHTVSAVLTGACGAVAADAAQVGHWVRRSTGLLGFGSTG